MSSGVSPVISELSIAPSLAVECVCVCCELVGLCACCIELVFYRARSSRDESSCSLPALNR